jgi:Bacterial dnaA protein helix-turn-helix
MESKQLYTVDQRSDVDVVRNIVEMVTGVSILAKNRKRSVVEARMIYATLLREAGYSLTHIAETIKKDHTTIIHYIQSLKDLRETDIHMMRKYLRCRELFILEKQPVNLVDEIDYESECDRLKNTIEIMKAENYLLNEEIVQLKVADENRLRKIIKLIEENTPRGYELIVERKIRKMFDD